MVMRLEIAFKPELFDSEGASMKIQARDYFGIEIDAVRLVTIITAAAGSNQNKDFHQSGNPDVIF